MYAEFVCIILVNFQRLRERHKTRGLRRLRSVLGPRASWALVWRVKTEPRVFFSDAFDVSVTKSVKIKDGAY